MKKVLLTYGLIAGLVVSAMMFLTFSGAILSEPSEILGYTTMVVAFSSIFFGIRTYRNNYLGGSITFGKAFMLGLYITLIASTMYVISWMIISETIAQGYMEEYFNGAIETIRQNSEMTQIEKETSLQSMENFREMYKNPIVKIGMTLLEIFPVGFVITIISAAILNKKKVVAD